MTRTVWKYSLNVSDGIDQILEIPGGGHFLTLRRQTHDDRGMERPPGVIIIDTWWAIDTDNDPKEVQLHIRGTGDEVPPSVTYLGSIFPGPYVFHLWNRDRVFDDMHIVDGKFVPKSQ